MNFPEPVPNPARKFVEGHGPQDIYRMFLEIDAKMLLTYVARDNLRRQFEKCDPVRALLFGKHGCHGLSSTFGETM
jgi:hypothetical protein